MVGEIDTADERKAGLGESQDQVSDRWSPLLPTLPTRCLYIHYKYSVGGRSVMMACPSLPWPRKDRRSRG